MCRGGLSAYIAALAWSNSPIYTLCIFQSIEHMCHACKVAIHLKWPERWSNHEQERTRVLRILLGLPVFPYPCTTALLPCPRLQFSYERRPQENALCTLLNPERVTAHPDIISYCVCMQWLLPGEENVMLSSFQRDSLKRLGSSASQENENEVTLNLLRNS